MWTFDPDLHCSHCDPLPLPVYRSGADGPPVRLSSSIFRWESRWESSIRGRSRGRARRPGDGGCGREGRATSGTRGMCCAQGMGRKHALQAESSAQIRAMTGNARLAPLDGPAWPAPPAPTASPAPPSCSQSRAASLMTRRPTPPSPCTAPRVCTDSTASTGKAAAALQASAPRPTRVAPRRTASHLTYDTWLKALVTGD